MALYNEKIVDVVLDQAPLNATYTSPKIQKEILHISSKWVGNEIWKEMNDAELCIIAGKARNQYKRANGSCFKIY